MGDFGVVLCIWYAIDSNRFVTSNDLIFNQTWIKIGVFCVAFLGHLLWHGVWIQVAHARMAWLLLGPGLQVTVETPECLESIHADVVNETN